MRDASAVCIESLARCKKVGRRVAVGWKSVFSGRDSCLPLPARNERGEGWGGGNYSASMIVPVSTMTLPPLPGPLLHGMEEREKEHAYHIRMEEREWTAGG